MIHYQLHCAAGHDFDGWFQDSAGFDRLAAIGLVECPHCGGTRVERALMAPALRKKGRKAATPVEAPPSAPAPPAGVPVPERTVPERTVPERTVTGPMPAQLLAMLQRMRQEVEKSCDYVGEDFAAQARKIHNGEAKVRGIYGEATEEQAEALADDGIEVSRMPWVPRADG